MPRAIHLIARLSERSATLLVRLLVVATAGLASIGGLAPRDGPIVALAGLYLGIATVLWAAAPRPAFGRFASLGVLVDLAAVTAFLVQAGPAAGSLWPAYLFPIALAAARGPIPALATGVLGAVVWLALGLAAPATPAGLLLWPAALLGAWSLALVIVLRQAYARSTAAARARARLADADRGARRRERLLRQAALEMLATPDRGGVAKAIARALRSSTDPAAGAGEHLDERAAAIAPEPDPSLRRNVPRAGAQEPPDRSPVAALTRFGGDAALLSLAERALVSDAAWLGELAELARAAWSTCATYEALRSERDRLRATLEAMPAPLVVRGVDGSRALDNAAYRALGLDAAASPAAGGPSEEELSVGEPARTFVATTVPVADAGGILTCLREVTRERQALRAKDELIATMGHELRNPLTSIHGYSQLMARQLESVRRQIDQLNRLVGDFMDAARLEGGQLPLKREVVDLAQVAAAAAERFRGAFSGRQLRLDLAAAVPVEGDPARLAQVVDNLLSNAAKYSPPDAEIALAVHVEGERAVLAVRDRGVGITPEHLPHLFERFYRAPGEAARPVEGLGIGLALVRDLVAAHGGQVRAESAGPGTGSTFAISLPVAAAPPSDGASDTNGSAGTDPVTTF